MLADRLPFILILAVFLALIGFRLRRAIRTGSIGYGYSFGKPLAADAEKQPFDFVFAIGCMGLIMLIGIANLIFQIVMLVIELA